MTVEQTDILGDEQLVELLAPNETRAIALTHRERTALLRHAAALQAQLDAALAEVDRLKAEKDAANRLAEHAMNRLINHRANVANKIAHDVMALFGAGQLRDPEHVVQIVKCHLLAAEGREGNG